MQDQGEIAELIRYALSNFTVTFSVIALIFALINLAIRPKPHTGAVITDIFLRWYLFWAVGVSSIYNAMMHVEFGQMAAAFIGWPDSPFQAEVGFASLGFGVVAIIAAWGSPGMRIAAVLGPAIFLLGDAAGHIRQMILADNFAPGNAGPVFWTDILIPVAGFLLLWFQHREANTAAAVISAEIVAVEAAPEPLAQH